MQILSVLSQKVARSLSLNLWRVWYRVSCKTLAEAFGISSGSYPSWAATGGSWGHAKGGGDGSGLPQPECFHTTKPLIKISRAAGEATAPAFPVCQGLV